MNSQSSTRGSKTIQIRQQQEEEEEDEEEEEEEQQQQQQPTSNTIFTCLFKPVVAVATPPSSLLIISSHQIWLNLVKNWIKRNHYVFQAHLGPINKDGGTITWLHQILDLEYNWWLAYDGNDCPHYLKKQNEAMINTELSYLLRMVRVEMTRLPWQPNPIQRKQTSSVRNGWNRNNQQLAMIKNC